MKTCAASPCVNKFQLLRELPTVLRSELIQHLPMYHGLAGENPHRI